MGTVISKAAGGIGSALGNAFAAPVKTIFGRSCEEICEGTWDIICFIENLCLSSLVRLLMVAILAYITLMFFYLLFKVGIIQCVCTSVCKMSWSACEAYWNALEEISCFLWHKIRNTKRVYRHKFEDLEEGYTSNSSSDDSLRGYEIVRRRRSAREMRRDRIRRSPHPTRLSSKRSYRSSGHHRVKLKTREVSVHLKSSGRIRKPSQLQFTRTVRRRRHW